MLIILKLNMLLDKSFNVFIYLNIYINEYIINLKVMIEKKEHVVSTRVGGRLFEILRQYAEKRRIRISDIVRDAVIYYLRIIYDHEEANNPIIVLSKSELKFLINFIKNEEDFQKLADICYKNGIKTLKYYTKTFKNDIKEDNIALRLRSLIRSLNEIVFSLKGQNWFNKVSYSFDKNQFIIAGLHDMNLNFSIFIKYFMKRYLINYEYEIIKENLQENKVHLIFQKKSQNSAKI